MHDGVESTTGGGATRGAGTARGTVGAAEELPHEARHADTYQRTARLRQHSPRRPHRLPGQTTFTSSLYVVRRKHTTPYRTAACAVNSLSVIGD